MEPGANVWVRDSGPETWVPGTILRKVPCGDDLYEMEVDLEKGGKASFKVNAGETEVADLKLRNSDDVSLVEDLITLPHLHEPAILHSLWERFYHGDIYTFTGPILIAVNPFKRLPIYTEEKLMTYYEHGLLATQGLKMSSPLAPHVYAIADAAYRAMMEAIRNRPPAGAGVVGSQSILISGESGAGKTESTKVVMKYLTTVGAPDGAKADATDSVMQKVLQSNPILEAFGNARTIRNDNSSRFGKFIELHFDKRGHLLGASIQTYLLEKVRLPNQAANERNFHIFYQLCAGASPEQRSSLHLGDVQDYHYTSQGQCFTLRQVDDRDEWALTLKAMRTLGFDDATRDAVLRTVAGLLHLGQVGFCQDASGEGSELEGDAYMQEEFGHAAELLHVARDYLQRTLTTRVVETRGEAFTVKLKVQQAMDARDALAKAVYGRLFNGIVARINACIATDLKESRATVSVLDIFGFECFLNNSFEQLCINYCNEMLQQQFNQFVFKMEQTEYEKEGIVWSFISFPDNQDCLDLIEGRPNGVLAMLDDECRLPKGSDPNFAGRLYKAYGESKRFYVTNKMKPAFLFGIRHYAGEVAYNTAGFLEKNKDQLPKEATNLFLSSASPFIQDLFSEAPPPKAPGSSTGPSRPKPAAPSALMKSPTPASGGGVTAPTVASQFKSQLNELMAKIHTTRPHYIRCLKPNDDLLPDHFDRLRVNEQLRYGGVLEAVRVARSGYPVRLPHPEFFTRYRCLATLPILSVTPDTTEDSSGSHVAPKKDKASSKLPVLPHVIKAEGGFEASRQWCQKVLDAIMGVQEGEQASGIVLERHRLLEREAVQLGKTKIFLRKTAYEVLEFKRSSRLTQSAVSIQSFFRAAVVRREYVIMRAAAGRLQRVLRGMRARTLARSLRRQRAALVLQTAFRTHKASKAYTTYRHAVLRLQAHYRGRQARRQVQALHCQQAAHQVQTWYRMAHARRAYTCWHKALRRLQGGYRIRVAKAKLRALRLEAKEIGSLQATAEKLKEEVRLLKEQAQKKAEADRAEKERQMAQERAAAAQEALAQLQHWKDKYFKLERTYQEEKGVRESLEARLECTVAECKDANEKLNNERDNARKYEEHSRRLESEMGRYEAELEAMQKQVHQAKQAAVLHEASLLHRRVPSDATLSLSIDTSASALSKPAPPLHRSRTGSSGLERSASLTVSHHILDKLSSPRNTGHKSSASLSSQPSGSGNSPNLDDLGPSATPLVQDQETPTTVLPAELLLSSEDDSPVPSFVDAASSASPAPSSSTWPTEAPTPDRLPSGSDNHLSRSGSSGSNDKLGTASPTNNGSMGYASGPPSCSPPHTSRRPAPAASTDHHLLQHLPTQSQQHPRRASLTLRHPTDANDSNANTGPGIGDELDDVVDLDDQEQEVNKHTLRRNRQEALTKLQAHLTSFRAELANGLEVQVCELGKSSSLVPMKMRLVDCNGSEDDVVRGRVVFELGKPKVKRPLLNAWFGANDNAKVLQVAPEPIKLSELYGIVRGLRRVRCNNSALLEATLVDEQHRALTLITLETPQEDSCRRGLVVLLDSRERRNHTLEGLRRVLHDLHCRSLADEGQAALAQLVDATNDLTLLEEEVRFLEHERRKLAMEMASREHELSNVQGDFEKVRAERLKLAKISNEQQSELTELREELDVQRQLIANVQKAMGAQFDEEKLHYEKMLEGERHVNKELQDKMVRVQMDNARFKEEVARLRTSKEEVDAEWQRTRQELHMLQVEVQGYKHHASPSSSSSLSTSTGGAPLPSPSSSSSSGIGSSGTRTAAHHTHK